MAKYVFGIDLGTTYSCIAYVNDAGVPTVIKNWEGDNTTPSVVNFASPNEVVVGKVAKENAVIDPENTVSLVKTLMGKTNFAINYNGEDKTPEEVSAYILRKVAGDAAKQLDTEVKDVVITCPAYFGSAERTATKNAGTIAGLNVLEIISEPTAAAIYYGCTKNTEPKTILIFDLGGGTFDVTVMHITPEKIEVICSDGNHELGGRDWDEAIMRYVQDEFCDETGFDGGFDDYTIQDLRTKAEEAKKQLTSREEVPVRIDAEGLRAAVKLSRETFDELTKMLLNEALIKTDAAIAVAKDKGYGIDEILLVGGSTRMPQVEAALKERYGMDPKILEPDEAVAKGAAIHAVDVYVNHQQDIAAEIAENGGETADGETEVPEDLAAAPIYTLGGGAKPEVVNATTKSLGLEVYDKKKKESLINNLIKKNEPMPDGSVSVTNRYGTSYANQQEVELVVYESDITEDTYPIDEFYKLGDATLKLPPNLPEGAEIEVTFTLNSEGILEVTGKDLTTGAEIHATMQSNAIMSAEDVEKLAEAGKKISVI